MMFVRLIRSFVLSILVIALGIGPSTQRSHADEPLTATVFLIGTISAAVISAGGTIVGAWIARPTDTSEDGGQDASEAVEPSRNDVNIEIESDGTPLQRTIDSKAVHLPKDLNIDVPAGFKIAEDINFDVSDNGLSLSADNMFHQARVDNASSRFVRYRVIRTAELLFERPDGVADDAESVILFDLTAKDLKLSTTDLEQTQGSSFFRIRAFADGIGDVYQAYGRVIQGGNLITNGLISAESFVIGSGTALLPDFSTSHQMEIPAGVEEIRLGIVIETGGFGLRTNE